MAVFRSKFVFVFQSFELINRICISVEAAQSLITIFRLTLQKCGTSDDCAKFMDRSCQRVVGNEEKQVVEQIVMGFRASNFLPVIVIGFHAERKLVFR